MKRIQAGVTLIELVIGLAIIGMLFGFALPSYQAWMQNAQVRTAAESIRSGLQMARAEAIRWNIPVTFSLTDGTNRTTGWEIRTSTNQQVRSQPNSSTPNARIGTNKEDHSSVTNQTYGTALTTVANDGRSVTFNSLGRAILGSVTRIDVTNSSLASARRLVITISPGGQIRMCDPQFTIANNPQGCR